MHSSHFRAVKEFGGQWGALLIFALLIGDGLRITNGKADADDIPRENSITPFNRDSQFPVVMMTQRLPVIEADPTASNYPLVLGESDDDRGQPEFGAWGGGAELLMLKPYHSMGVQGVQGTDFSFDLQSSARAWIGYNAANGFGVRARYWEYDNSVSGPSIVAGRTESLAFDTYALDLELTSACWTCHNWDVLLSGGLRYLEYTQRSQTTINLTGALGELHELHFSGFGPTLSAYLYRPMFCNFGPFANLRSSVLMGDETEISTGVFNDIERDNIRTTWEVQLGAEWRRALARGSELFLRGAYEVQYWDSFAGEEAFDGGESVGFAGVAFAVGISR